MDVYSRFYCHELRLVIEVDGSIHNMKEVKESDVIRQEDIITFGIKVIRFTNQEVRTNIVGVLEKIRNVINEIRSNQISNEKPD